MKHPRITTNILQVLKNKAERAAATFVISPNENYYMYKGDKIKPSHFALMLPLEVKQTKTVID
jgi:hypothetical protein